MKKLLLSIEAMILLIPLSVAVCYASALTLIIGIPASIAQQLDAGSSYDPMLPLSAIGNIAGVYALVVLWSLVLNTIQGRRYTFTHTFRLGVVAGIVASLCLIIIYDWPALVFGVIPPVVLAIHFVIIQRMRFTNA
jgi:hypothetical protein